MRKIRLFAASLVALSLTAGAAWAQQAQDQGQAQQGQPGIQGQQQQQQPGVGQGFGEAGSALREAAVTPQGFCHMASRVNLFEVKASQLAQDKSSNDQVKSLAKTLQQDHQNLSSELKNIATSKNIEVPSDLGRFWQARYDQLNQLQGTQFDQQYVQDIVRSHQMAINLFQAEAERGTDADLKAFAARNLPHLQEHLRSAQQLQATVGMPQHQQGVGGQQGQQGQQGGQQQEQQR